MKNKTQPICTLHNPATGLIATVTKNRAGPTLTVRGAYQTTLRYHDIVLPLRANWEIQEAARAIPETERDRLLRRADQIRAEIEALLSHAANSWFSRQQDQIRHLARPLADSIMTALAEDLSDNLARHAFRTAAQFKTALHDNAGRIARRARLAALAEAVRAETNLADWISLYPAARAMKRRLRLFVGPTNSGKTHRAFERLVDAESGCYLAPLRLLALEGYDRLLSHNLPASLRTGEETREDPSALHNASTVEMADLATEVDVALIDEIQMIADPQRGWAWTAAVAGLPAREVIMMGSADAIPIIQAIAARTGDDLEVQHFERLSPLEVETRTITLKDLRPGDALIAFSRSEIMRLRHQLNELGHQVATIYGALGPEVRKAQANRFRTGEAPILVATDAIGMGLNLPIRRIVFSTLEKFDGRGRRPLSASEIRQIAGRAGRFGFADSGKVAVLASNQVDTVRRALTQPLPPIVDLRPWLMPPVSAILKMADAYRTQDLGRLLGIFSAHIMTEGSDCRAPDFQSMIQVSDAIAPAGLPLETRWCYAAAPIDTKSDATIRLIASWAKRHAKVEANACPRLPSIETPEDDHELLEMEWTAKAISAYLWMHQRFPASYPEAREAWYSLEEANRLIELAMRGRTLAPTCRSCRDPLPPRHKFTICDSCYDGARIVAPPKQARRHHHRHSKVRA